MTANVIGFITAISACIAGIKLGARSGIAVMGFSAAISSPVRGDEYDQVIRDQRPPHPRVHQSIQRDHTSTPFLVTFTRG